MREARPDDEYKADVTRIMKKQVLTTGDVSIVCNVAPRTVSKWIDTGVLKGYKIPNSADRRVTRDSLRQFIVDNDMDVPLVDINGLTQDAEVQINRDRTQSDASENVRAFAEGRTYDAKLLQSDMLMIITAFDTMMLVQSR